MKEFMMEFMPYILGIIGGLIVFAIILTKGYVKASPDTAIIISGLGSKPRMLLGRAGFMIPFLERKDALLMKQISVDIKTRMSVPTKDFIGVTIDAVAKVRMMSDPEGLQRAMRNFLNMNEDKISYTLKDSLEGNMREIIGTIYLKDLVTDRKEFGDAVQDKAQIDMNALGVEIISCNVQEVADEKNLIGALGMDNMAMIQKNASIAKAQAERDVAIAQSKAEQEANEARVNAQTEIAKRNTDLAVKQSELKAISDTKKAEADVAYELMRQEKQKEIATVTVNAQIAQAEREAELKKQEVAVKQQLLEAEVNRQADAEKYAIEQRASAQRKAMEEQAQAELAKRRADAEAQLIEAQKKAEALKAKSDADMYEAERVAKAIELKGKAEAQAIMAKGKAEAEALEKKAESMKKYGQAAMLEMLINKLPEIAEAVANPVNRIDKITIIDGGNGSNGVDSVGSYVPTLMAKSIESIKETTGIDIRDIMMAESYDAKVNKNITVNKESDLNVGLPLSE